MNVTKELIAALATLREGIDDFGEPEVSDAMDALEEAGVFTDIDAADLKVGMWVNLRAGVEGSGITYQVTYVSDRWAGYNIFKAGVMDTEGMMVRWEFDQQFKIDLTRKGLS